MQGEATGPVTGKISVPLLQTQERLEVTESCRLRVCGWSPQEINQLVLQPSAQWPVHFPAPKEARQERAAHSNSAHGGSPTSDLP